MEKAEIKILGHSGCAVEIVENFGEISIRKATVDQSYIPRLCAQIEKQKKFSALFKSIGVPKVYGEYKSASVYFAQMQYIPALDIFNFISIASKENLDSFFSVIEGYLTESLDLSQQAQFPLAAVNEKLAAIETQLGNKAPSAITYISKLKEILKLKTFPSIPMGVCHGDLTFSNILIEPEYKNIYLIDFLDSFIESPLQDIVKIKQDVVHHWSSQKSKEGVDDCRTRIAFEYLNKKLNQFITDHAIDNSVLSLFQIINLLRILPYTHDDETINFLLVCINNELNDLENNI